MGKRDIQPSTNFCLACGYSLRELTTHRCPECGRPFDPVDLRTMSIGAPLRPWQRWLLKPIGWPTITLALLGTTGLVYLGHRPHLWPEPWSVMRDEFRWPTKDLWPFTTPELVLYASVVLWWPFLILLAVRTFSWPLVPRTARQGNTLSQAARRRRNLVALAFMLSALCVVFGWQQRVGQRWIVRAMALPPTQSPWSYYYPRPIAVQPGFHLSQEEYRAVLDNLLVELPHANERMEALRFMVEDSGNLALPALTNAAKQETDTEVLAWELRLIGLCRDPASASVLIAHLQDSRPQVRAAAADAIGILRHPTYPIDVIDGPWSTPELHLDSVPPITVGKVVWPHLSGWRSNDDMPDFAIDPAVRPVLEKMMLEGATADEREAAARALVAWPPAKYQLRVAEWGVWISKNGDLTLIKSILDEIPPFVHRTGNSISSLKDYFMIWEGPVTKPIVHLTTDVPMAVDVEVRIRQGRPWFGYPMPDDFGISNNPEIEKDKELGTAGVGWSFSATTEPATTAPVPDDFAVPAISPLLDCREGYPWLMPHHRVRLAGGPWDEGPGYVYALGLRWQSLIVSPAKLPWMVPPTVPADPRYRWWTRLRDVPSDWVANRGETERFLYYDGPTRSKAPVQATLGDSGHTLSFFKMPENTGEAMNRREFPHETFKALETPSHPNLPEREGIYIDVHDGVARGQYISIDDLMFPRKLQPDLPLQGPALIQRFREMLLAYGLTAPEAEGLIAAWTPQFFQTEGRRFILRMSPADYDRQCPMQVRPKPTEIVRLGLVLTEFDEKSMKDTKGTNKTN